MEIGFAEECGGRVEGDPRPRRRWSQRGSRHRIPSCGDHGRAHVIGAVCPASAKSFVMVFDGVDTAVFQCSLDELARIVAHDPAKRRILIVENATWHKSQHLNFHPLECAFLSAYSPDFNPMERLGLRLKADHFADFSTDDSQALVDHLCYALNALMDAPDHVASQCAFRK